MRNVWPRTIGGNAATAALLALAASLDPPALADQPSPHQPQSDFEIWRPLPTADGLGPPEPHYQGIARPLMRESWLYRPFSAGWFVGMEQGSPLIDDWAGLDRGFVGGYRLGWDHSHYWGAETRFAFASVELLDSRRAIDAQLARDPLATERFDARRDADLFQWDVDVLYYPWGNSQWRPYFLAGVGVSRTIFTDRLSRRFDEVAFMVPLALGVKYRCSDWLALRFEVVDNIAFASGRLETVHHLLVTGGIEVRFGGSRTSYWPWNPGLHYW